MPEFRGGVNWKTLFGLGEPKPKRGPREKKRDEFVKWVIQFGGLEWDRAKLLNPDEEVQARLVESVMKIIWGDALERDQTYSEEEVRGMAAKVVAHYRAHPPKQGKKPRGS